MRSALPVPPECGYNGAPEPRIPCTEGCVNPIDTDGCDQPDDERIFVFSTSGQFGYIVQNQSVSCSPIDSPGNQATCSTCSGAYDRFQLDTLCGQPHTCGNRSDWGCVSPLVDVNGICQRSLKYQNSCSNGYDSLACSCLPTPTPTPTPSPTPPPGSCQGPSGSNCIFSPNGIDCPDPGYPASFPPCCCFFSPIVVDVEGDGFDLTDADGGVRLDASGQGAFVQTGWTRANSDDAWLALDRNGNGTIDSGQELFGNFTPQPTSSAPNGFIALAEYDKTTNGGNNDGRISSQDTIFNNLRLWQDVNHNGFSETNELKTLPTLGLAIIDLDYHESNRTDEHGNRFKYRAKVRDVQGAQIGRWAWDVFPVAYQSQQHPALIEYRKLDSQDGGGFWSWIFF